MAGDYINGLKKAIELIEQSSEADELSMEGLIPELSGAKVASKQAVQLINDEILMCGSQ